MRQHYNAPPKMSTTKTLPITIAVRPDHSKAKEMCKDLIINVLLSVELDGDLLAEAEIIGPDRLPGEALDVQEFESLEAQNWFNRS